MALNLYRRHRQDCVGGHPEDSRSGELEERKKTWTRCNCAIFTSGTLRGRFLRRSTGQWTWEEAKAVAAAWELAGSVDGPSARPTPTSNASRPITVEAATDAYLKSCRNRGLTAPTLSKYRTLVKQLREYCQTRGCLCLEQLTVTDMDAIYAAWKDGKRSKAKKLERLKGFVNFAVKRNWLAANITEDLRAPEGSSIPADKMPFSDDELSRIYAACDRLGGPVAPGPGHRRWSGEDVKDFILLSVYTGLRISDASTFDISRRLKGNDVYLRQHKTRKELWTWIPDWLVERLRNRELKCGSLIFRDDRTCTTTSMRNMAEIWRIRLGKVFKLAGEFESAPHPHRLRYTFVRILLEKGVPIADVSELIGDTEEVVRRHYAKWVPERQARLTKVLKSAFAEKSLPENIVEMPKAGTK